MESETKTILLFSDWYLPGYKAGGPITSCANLVAHLGSDFKFKVVCGDRDYLENQPYEGLKTNEWIEVGNAKVIYLAPERQNLSEIKNIINRVSPDVVYLNGMFSKVFTLFPLFALRNDSTQVVAAPRGMLAPAAMAIKSLKKRIFLNLSKAFGLFSKVIFHATNSIESNQITDWFPQASIKVVANIPGHAAMLRSRSNHVKERNCLSLYTVARVAPEKNLHFALECLKDIDEDIKVSFDVIGAVYDREYYRRCKKISEDLPSHVSVNFLGPMPPSRISEIAVRADFFFLPTAGENYGHAIVEALLTGVPVVISQLTPWRNLSRSGLGFDLELKHEEFSKTLNAAGKMSNDAYRDRYKNTKTNAEALVNLDKLQIGYKKLFDDRN